MPAIDTQPPSLHLSTSLASTASWGKWLLMAMFVFELIMFMTKR
jgi:hypothetical protein